MKPTIEAIDLFREWLTFTKEVDGARHERTTPAYAEWDCCAVHRRLKTQSEHFRELGEGLDPAIGETYYPLSEAWWNAQGIPWHYRDDRSFGDYGLVPADPTITLTQSQVVGLFLKDVRFRYSISALANKNWLETDALEWLRLLGAPEDWAGVLVESVKGDRT